MKCFAIAGCRSSGCLADGLVVAIKRFISSGYADSKYIEKEIQLISKLEHNNIVKCLGYVFEVLAEERHFCIVNEYMPNGDLEGINLGIMFFN